MVNSYDGKKYLLTYLGICGKCIEGKNVGCDIFADKAPPILPEGEGHVEDCVEDNLRR